MLAVTLAGVALLDVLTGRAGWGHKAGWALLVLGLPVVGPLLYFRRIAGGAAPKRGGADRPRRPPAAP
jgi:hypothetical protein